PDLLDRLVHGGWDDGEAGLQAVLVGAAEVVQETMPGPEEFHGEVGLRVAGAAAHHEMHVHALGIHVAESSLRVVVVASIRGVGPAHARAIRARGTGPGFRFSQVPRSLGPPASAFVPTRAPEAEPV